MIELATFQLPAKPLHLLSHMPPMNPMNPLVKWGPGGPLTPCPQLLRGVSDLLLRQQLLLLLLSHPHAGLQLLELSAGLTQLNLQTLTVGIF